MKEQNVLFVKPCKSLVGELSIQGSKNSVLPIMAASLINKGITMIDNCPDILDVHVMAELLTEIGCDVSFENHCLIINTSDVADRFVFSQLSCRLRASILLLSASLVRGGNFCMPCPGGCAIGKRPFDYHVDIMTRLGANIYSDRNIISGSMKEICEDKVLRLPFPSVGATENFLIAACGGRGINRLCNYAKEPEIYDLCEYLRLLGAKIEFGEELKVEGIGRRFGKDVYIRLPGDRIVCGTMLCAVAMTGGRLVVRGCDSDRLCGVCNLLGARNCDNGIELECDRACLARQNIVTGPFPAFPTDLQPIFMTLMSVCEGGTITESVFETRLQTATELNRLGAGIVVNDTVARIPGHARFCGSEVFCNDLRNGAALVIAGLFSESGLIVHNAEHIFRGYERLIDDLRALGATIF